MDYIITPTFKGHFPFIKRYLESFCKYVEDPQDVTICFTIGEEEEEDFGAVIAPYQKLCKIQVCIFDDILEQFKIPYTSSELMERYGKFTFQTFKKFLTILSIGCKHSLILDSESMWIASTNMKKLFEDFFAAPFITVSDIYKRKWDRFSQTEISNIGLLLQTKCTKWPLENFVWFYDIDILKQLFQEYGSLLNMAEEIYWENCGQAQQPGIFEILLYQQYIYMNAKRFGYEVVEIDKAIEKAFSKKDFTAYKKAMLQKYNCAGGFAEHASEYLTSTNWEALADVMRENRQWIIRCDQSQSYRIYQKQKPFIEKAGPYILAASQEHFFGINCSFAKIAYQTILYGVRKCKRKLREATKSIFRKISPAYKASSEARDVAMWLGDNFNWRINNLERLVTLEMERRLEGAPNILSDLQYGWMLDVCRRILDFLGAAWFPNKKVLIVDGAYGDAALYFQRFGASVDMTERRAECCSIAAARLLAGAEVLHLPTQEAFQKRTSWKQYDLIIDLGNINYNEMPFIYSWLSMSAKIVFGLKTTNRLSLEDRLESRKKKDAEKKQKDKTDHVEEVNLVDPETWHADEWGTAFLESLKKADWQYTSNTSAIEKTSFDPEKRVTLYYAVKQ